MKKKLMAVLLTLCMVLGMLPMSALAAWYKADNTEVTVTSFDEATGLVKLTDNDSVTYYGKFTSKTNQSTFASPADGDTLEYYPATDTSTKTTLTWYTNPPTTDDKVQHEGNDHVTSAFPNEDGTHTVKCPVTNCVFNDTAKPVDCTLVADTNKTDVAATCVTEGTKYLKCSVCEWETSEPIDVDKTNHEGPFINYSDNGDGTHNADCEACETEDALKNESHDFTTGENTGECVCGATAAVVETNPTPEAGDSEDQVVVDLQIAEDEDAIDQAFENAEKAENNNTLVLDATVDTTSHPQFAGKKDFKVKIPSVITKGALGHEDVKLAIPTNVGTITIPAGLVEGDEEVDLEVNTGKAMSQNITSNNEKIQAKLDQIKSAPTISIELTREGVRLATHNTTSSAGIEINLDAPDNAQEGWFMFWAEYAEDADGNETDEIVSLDRVSEDAYVNNQNKIRATLGHLSDYPVMAYVEEGPSGSGGGGGGTGGGGGGGSSVSHRIEVAPTTNGTIKVSPLTAVSGEKVTITVTPNEGYELDTLKVTDANSNELTLTKVDDSTCTFLMANTTVTVTGAFKKIAAAGDAGDDGGFSDVPSSNTFYDDIMWVAGRGYMNGYTDGTFRPGNNTTRQALWMVLARIDGANPSDMSAARAWAVSSGISDGTNPEGAMSRQQMVTMLYRYAQLKGYNTSGGASISAYPDTNSVADYAKDAMSWAVGNGIVQGTNAGTLNPEGTALRSHFAAFLHRFCQTVGIA